MADTGFRPHISLIIPAYNEEAYLPPLLKSVNQARSVFAGGAQAVEVIVVDNGSTDRTAVVAAEHGARVVRETRRIIAAVRNTGVRSSHGELLAFVDADAVIHPQTFNAIVSRFEQGKIVAGASGVRLPRMSVALFLTYAIMLPMVWLTGMDTGVVFCRRVDFDAFGGYNEALLFGEDVDFLLQLRRLGKTRREKLCRLRCVKSQYSYRKFDEHGEWHYLLMIARVLWAILFNKQSLTPFAQKYWYGDQRPPDSGRKRF